MPRPRRDLDHEGLTRPQAAKLLKISIARIKKLQKDGVLRSTPDESGVHRIRPGDVESYARRRGIELAEPESIYKRAYKHFLAPGFRPTPKAFAQVVADTGASPDLIGSLYYEKFLVGPRTPEEALVHRHYNEQIRAMKAELQRDLERPADDVPDSR
jgi:hypothetical protein